MDNFFDSEFGSNLKVLLVIFLVCVVTIFTTVFGIYCYEVNFGKANLISIECDNKIIYKGKYAYVEIISGGSTTTVNINKQLFPIAILESTYTSKNIKIEPLKIKE